MDNIGVRPSTTTGSVKVATDEVLEGVDNVHYPIYKIATGEDGSAIPISDDNPLPTEALGLVDQFRNLLEVNREILNQLKIMNAHYSEWDGDNYDN